MECMHTRIPNARADGLLLGCHVYEISETRMCYETNKVTGSLTLHFYSGSSDEASFVKKTELSL